MIILFLPVTRFSAYTSRLIFVFSILLMLLTYYEGFHNVAVSADFDYDNGMGLGFHGCPPNHS